MATGSDRRWFPRVPSAALSAETPADRDRVMDGLRAAALAVVVLGHGVMAVVAWPGGVPVLGNLLAGSLPLQALTWALQAMPWFFIVGGYANARSWQRALGEGRPYPQWVWGRAQRLLRPLWPYLAITCSAAAVTTALAPTQVAEPLLLLITQLLWFLGAYLLVTSLTPLLARGAGGTWTTPLLLLLAAVAVVDLCRFALGAPAAIGLLNFVLVWAVPAYAGTLRAVGALRNVSRTRSLAWAALLLLDAALLVAIDPYPLSLVGMPGDPVSNMAPPTLVVALHALALAFLVTAADAPLRRLFARPAVWRRAVGMNLVGMTVYLWHLPMLVVLTTVLHALHLERPTSLDANGFPRPSGWDYLWGSLPFLVAFLALVWVVVRLLWPLEHAKLPWWDGPVGTRVSSPRRASVLSIIGALGVGVSTLMLSATGLGGFPTRVIRYEGVPLSAAVALLVLAASAVLLRRAGGQAASTADAA